MRKLFNADHNYGLVLDPKLATLFITVNGVLRENFDEDKSVLFTFNLDTEELYTTEELNSLGRGRLLIRVYVTLSDESSEIYKTNIQHTSHIREIVDYEVKKKILNSSSALVRANFEVANVLTKVIPSDCDLNTVQDMDVYQMQSGGSGSQLFPLGYNLDELYLRTAFKG